MRNTQQVTKAMKLVAAAKLRRAQDAIIAARPYAAHMGAVLRSLASRVPAESHPLLARREPRRVLLLAVTADRGLCGGFNANVLRRGLRFVHEPAEGVSVSLALVGRKGNDYFRRRDVPIRHYFKGVLAELSPARGEEIGRALVEDYASGAVDAVHVLYNGFKSAGSQVLTLDQLLPVATEELPAGDPGVEYLYEPGKEALLDALLPRHVAVQVYRVLLESVAAENGARMAAMEAATKNAGEMIDHLTLQANRARQAAITKELLEIVAGAEAQSKARAS
jgi:F-type H+-transporting ATPase subunit gamma